MGNVIDRSEVLEVSYTVIRFARVENCIDFELIISRRLITT